MQNLLFQTLVCIGSFSCIGPMIFAETKPSSGERKNKSANYSGPLPRGGEPKLEIGAGSSNNLAVPEQTAPSQGEESLPKNKNVPVQEGVPQKTAERNDPSATKPQTSSIDKNDVNSKSADPTGNKADQAKSIGQNSSISSQIISSPKQPRIFNCSKFIATPLGSVGGFSADGNIFHQLYIKSVAPDGYNQVLEEMSLKDKTPRSIMTLKMPKVDVMAFENQDGAEGVNLVSYLDNSDSCFNGTGRFISFRLRRGGLEGPLEMVKQTTKLTTLSDFDANWRFWEHGSQSLYNFQFDPFLKRHVNFKINPIERLLWVGRGSNKRTYVTFRPPSSDGKIKPAVISYDLNGNSTMALELEEGEKFLFSESSTLGKIFFEQNSPNIRIKELKLWGSGRKDLTYSFRLPKGFSASQLEFLVNFEKRVLVAFGQGDFNRSFTRSVLVLDYMTGQELSRLRLDRGILGAISMDPNGSFLVAEEVEAKSKERIKLHFFEVVTGKWNSIKYK